MKSIVETIRRYFGFLFAKREFTVITECYFDSFDNWVVVLESKDCRIRFFQDRGEVTIAFGPVWSPPNWQSGPWYDLRVMIRYITQGNEQWEYQGGSTEEQFEHLAKKLRRFWQQICQLFRDDIFPQEQQVLQKIQEEMDDEFWDSLGF